MAGQWFYAANGGQAGPVDTDELRRLAAEGTLKPTDLLWREGMPEWIPATKVTGLFAASPQGAAAPAEPSAGYAPAPQPTYAASAGMLPYQGGGGMTDLASPRSIELLQQTRPWVLLFSVLMFIGAGLFFIIGLGAAACGMVGGRGTAVFTSVIGAAYGLAGLLYFFPALFLGRYGSRIGTLTVTRRADSLEAALEAQKSFWKFMGIMTLVMIGLWFLMLIVTMVIGAAARSGM